MIKKIATVAVATVLLSLASAQPARADWLLTPFLGVTFGGDANSQEVSYGGSISWMGAGVFGFELDASITPHFFDTDDLANGIEDSNVSAVMANLIVGAPFGAPGVRPYASAGAGILRTRATSFDNVFDLNENSFGFNIGGGLIGFVTENFGLRGDLRYFRSLQDTDAGDDIDLDLGGFHFWRATVGATFRF